MGNHLAETDLGNHLEALKEDMDGAKEAERREEETKEKEKDSKESAIHAERKDIALDSARRKEDRKEETKEEENQKDSRVHATYVEHLATAPTTVGTLARAKEAKEEHT